MKNKRGLFYLIRSDFQKRAEIDNRKHPLYYILTLVLNQSLLGIVMYRLAHFFYTKKLSILAKLITFINSYLCAMFIDYKCVIGERFCLAHSFAVLIHGNVVIGDNVLVCQCVDISIGPRKNMKPDDKVIIGDNTMIFSGAKIFGNIAIGKNVKIGANSVVLESLPDNAIVGGIPARVIRIEADA